MVASDPKHFNNVDSSKITMGPFPTYKEKKVRTSHTVFLFIVRSQ
jgi:hypothetical protein